MRFLGPPVPAPWADGFGSWPWATGVPYWSFTPGGGFAKQYPPGLVGIPYAYYPGYGLVM